MDFGQSKLENRFVVCEGVDAQLDDSKGALSPLFGYNICDPLAVKARYRALPALLSRVAASQMAQLGLRACKVVYVPMVGYLLAVEEGTILPPDHRLQYSVGGVAHFKNDCMGALDQSVGDLKLQIIDHETGAMLKSVRVTVAADGVPVKWGVTIFVS